jgi:hypothetical protein
VELDLEGLTGEFRAFVEPLSGVELRVEIAATQIAAPRGIAPQSLAVSVEVAHETDSDHGVGRLVFCFDDSHPEGWNAPMRVIGYAKSPIETYMAEDDYLAQLPWQWLGDSLSLAGASYRHEAGTTTTAISTGHGALAAQPQHAELEIRASWAPMDTDARPHLRGWVEMLALISGLPPLDKTLARIK